MGKISLPVYPPILPTERKEEPQKYYIDLSEPEISDVQIQKAKAIFEDGLRNQEDNKWQFSSADTDLQYNFGQNWVDFARQMVTSDVNDVNLQTRTRLVASQLQVDFDAVDFSTHTFLDVGCGAGLNSMAASIFLGAKVVVSVDVQDGSLLATHMLRNTVFFGLKPALSAPKMRDYVRRMHEVEKMPEESRSDTERYFAMNNHRSDGPGLILPAEDERVQNFQESALAYEHWASGAAGGASAASSLTRKLYYGVSEKVPYPFTHMVRRNGQDEDKGFHWIIAKGSILDEGFVNFLLLLMEEVHGLEQQGGPLQPLLPTWEAREKFYEKLKHPFYRVLDRGSSTKEAFMLPEAFDVCSGLFCTSAYNLLAPRIVPELYESDNTKNETPGILQLNQEPQHWRAKITQALEKYDAEPGAIERILAGQDQWLRARALHRFDFVYCYGVLMHTGDLRTAAENIFALTHTGGGKLFFAIYNPHYWPEHKSDDYLQQKKEYLALPEWAKQVWDTAYMFGELHQPIIRLMDSMDAVGRSLFVDVLKKHHSGENKETAVIQGRTDAANSTTTLVVSSDFDVVERGGSALQRNSSVAGVESHAAREERKQQERQAEGQKVPVQPTTATAQAPSIVFSSWMSTLQRTKALRDVLLYHFGAFTSGRGMSFYHDTRDALGGWPVEFATEEDLAKIFAEIGIFGYPHHARFIQIEKGAATTGFLASPSFGAVHDYDGLIKTTQIFGRDENILVSSQVPAAPGGGEKGDEHANALSSMNNLAAATLAEGLPLAPKYVAFDDHSVTSKALPVVNACLGGESAVKVEWSHGTWEKAGASYLQR